MGAEKQFSPFLSLPGAEVGAGTDLSLAWAPGTESRDTLPRIISLKNKYRSIIARLKDSLGSEGQRTDGGAGGRCEFVCVYMCVFVGEERERA